MRTKYTKETLREIVKESTNMIQVLNRLGLRETGGNHSHISKIVRYYDLDISHFGSRSNKGRPALNKHTKESFVKEVLCENGKGWKGQGIKKKLIEFKLKEDICEICGIVAEWNGKPLSLQLDHINGDHFDNRLENLQIVCPNCHTQLETFSCKTPR